METLNILRKHYKNFNTSKKRAVEVLVKQYQDGKISQETFDMIVSAWTKRQNQTTH